MNRPSGSMPRLSRRDFFKLAVGAAGGYAMLKVGARVFIGPPPPEVSHDPARLHHLSPRLERIVTAAALAIVGPAAEQAYRAGRWDPAADVDRLFEGLEPDQRSMAGVGLHLFEEWTWGLRGFSALERDAQLEHLARWASSPLALKRSVWGLLHAAACSSFSGGEDGWAVMGYPGPCLARGDHHGRSPGQSVAFEWDERVP